nr:immunoglobulin heavy chain junction region [Macaca mulatta]
CARRLDYYGSGYDFW